MHNLLLSTLGLDQICWQNFEQNRDLKAMSNLLAKWAVKYSKFSQIGIVDFDGPLIAFQCAVTMPCAPF